MGYRVVSVRGWILERVPGVDGMGVGDGEDASSAHIRGGGKFSSRQIECVRGFVHGNIGSSVCFS